MYVRRPTTFVSSVNGIRHAASGAALTARPVMWSQCPRYIPTDLAAAVPGQTGTIECKQALRFV